MKFMARRVNVDLHNHLRTSSDMSKLNFNRVVNTASKRLGKGGILGVVNMEDERYEDFTQLDGYGRTDFNGAIYVPERNVLVIKGQEIPTKEGFHVLGIGLPSEVHVESGQPIRATLEKIKELKGVSGIDHPFGHCGAGQYILENKDILEDGLVDFWESHNGEASLWIPGVSKMFAIFPANL